MLPIRRPDGDSTPRRAASENIMERWRLKLTRFNLKYLLATTLATFLLVLFVLRPADKMTRQQDYSVISLMKHDSRRGVTPVVVDSMAEMQVAQHQRRDHVQQVCARNGIFPQARRLVPSHFSSIYVDDRHEFMYCMIPKVACTNWKRVLLVLSGHVNESNPFDISPAQAHGREYNQHLKTLDMYDVEQIQYRLDNYFKFMFVRDPFERLLSAYRNKFTVSYNSYFPQRYGRNIIRKFRQRPSRQALRQGTDVTFQEFTQYLLDPETEKPFNAHWRQYYKICHPCIVQYDVIGKYETLDADTNYILNEAGISDVITFPKANRLPGRPKTADILQQTYGNLSSEDIHRLWETYSVDFSMFGYPYPDFSGPH